MKHYQSRDIHSVKRKSKKVLVINDLDPRESRGAASMALSLTERTFDKDEIIFLCTSKKAFKLKKSVFATFYSIPENSIDYLEDKVRNRFPNFEGFLRIFAFRRLWRILRIILRHSPRIIWVHQIGWRVPITSLLIFRLLKIPVVLTIHDFSFLRFRKIYIEDFAGEKELVESKLKAFHENSSQLTLQFRDKPNIWQWITRIIIANNSEIIYLSDLQSEIYTLNGYPKGHVIPNSVRKCKCGVELKPKRNKVAALEVLFAGRLIGKGLERLAFSILENECAHLHIAGGNELKSVVQNILPEHKFTYHGMLSEAEIFELLHSIDITVVGSFCFDVLPTIALESLAHGTPFISTPTTGVYNLSLLLGTPFTLSLEGKIDFDEICQSVRKFDAHRSFDYLSQLVTSNDSVEKYQEIFRLKLEICSMK